MATDRTRGEDPLQLTRSLELIGGDGRALRRDLAAGTVVGLRRGAYVAADTWSALTDRDRYLLRMRAATATRAGDAVFGYESAAALWSLPVIGSWPDTVHLYSADGGRRASRNGVMWHHAPLSDTDIVELNGTLVTSLSRTMLDLARSATFLSAVVTLDAALARAARGRNDTTAAELVRSDLLERLAALGSARGTRRALAAITFASPNAESPGESASRVTMYRCGFPAPVLQFPVTDRNGTTWFADFGWPAFRLLGEFDGYVKYSRASMTGGTSIEEIVWAEKQREDLMRGTGNGMTRWLWDAALSPRLLTAALREAGLPQSRRR
ncbi:hypothetical protein [Mycetocola zhujimingii]|uniref:hypothetical protein n=1 Tax=Mycetocola zhujimingii TaxID=2079792 RepID=UPI000D33F5F0|nr:hypothetical protein [Mycetocola zhujimingii]AWB87546.1 hypothetical protein C3E77_13650 [Mycetocola zhujimingii]